MGIPYANASTFFDGRGAGAGGCSVRAQDDVDVDVERHETKTSAVITGRSVDVLFMIDNSSSMRLAQANLLTNFPVLMDALRGLSGGMPNLHVAVVSSDTGAGRRQYRGLRHHRRQQRHLPVHAARDLHGVAAERRGHLPVHRRHDVQLQR